MLSEVEEEVREATKFSRNAVTLRNLCYRELRVGRGRGKVRSFILTLRVVL